MDRGVGVHVGDVQLQGATQGLRTRQALVVLEMAQCRYLPGRAIAAAQAALFHDAEETVALARLDPPAVEPLVGEREELPQDQFVDRHRAMAWPVHLRG